MSSSKIAKKQQQYHKSSYDFVYTYDSEFWINYYEHFFKTEPHNSTFIKQKKIVVEIFT